MRIPPWYDDAGCRGMDRELFFPPGRDIITPEAEAACKACRVRRTCLNWSIETGQYGTWGGLSEKGRSDERRRRQRRAAAARAREDAEAVEDVA